MEKIKLKAICIYFVVKGASPEKRKLVGNPNAQIEIIFDGKSYTQVTKAGSKTFAIGEEYEQAPGEVGGKAKVLLETYSLELQ